MADARTTEVYTGFGRSNKATFTIANGADGSAVSPVDFGRGYAYFVIKCTDASKIQASTTLKVKVSYDDADAEVDLYEVNDPATIWTKGNLPTSGTFAFLLSHGFGAQKLRLIMSKTASGGSVPFEIYGFDPTVDDR